MSSSVELLHLLLRGRSSGHERGNEEKSRGPAARIRSHLQEEAGEAQRQTLSGTVLNALVKLCPSLSGLSPPDIFTSEQLMHNERFLMDGKDMASTDELRFVGEIPENSHTDSETQTIPSDERAQPSTTQVDQVVMDNLGRLFEHCIQQVSRLERQRDDLVQELLRLQEPMLRMVEQLRGKVAETQRLLALAEMDYTDVFEEVQRVKRKLFATARDCIQSQVTLAANEYEVAQSAVTQEELKTYIDTLSQELSQLNESQNIRLTSLRAQAAKPCRPRAMSDVSQCRQASASLQRRLSGSVRALEGWYEPRLMALLKRKQVGEDALRKSREQARDLRASLGPLREDGQRLELQRASLEQRIFLMEREREKRITRYKETVETLRETLRELEGEFDVQRQSKKGLVDLKDGLLTELTFLRGCDEASKNTAEEEP